MEKRRIPGLQIAIVHHGKIVMLGSYGTANVQNAVPVTDQTVFSINSATKSFTGVAIMQLVDEGKLDLSAPVSRYRDGLPAAWQPITIRQLLTTFPACPRSSTSASAVPADCSATGPKRAPSRPYKSFRWNFPPAQPTATTRPTMRC
ncbi:MAG: serine hydrolase domain-containing protein [Pyrinomonadaceae bacterium]